MQYRPLPVVAELQKLEQEDQENGTNTALEYRKQICRELFASKGLQLVVGILRRVESNALDALYANIKPDYQCGRMAAVEEIRRLLDSLSPEVDAPTEVNNDEVEESFFPPSGFNIPHPSGA